MRQNPETRPIGMRVTTRFRHHWHSPPLVNLEFRRGEKAYQTGLSQVEMIVETITKLEDDFVKVAEILKVVSRSDERRQKSCNRVSLKGVYCPKAMIAIFSWGVYHALRLSRTASRSAFAVMNGSNLDNVIANLGVVVSYPAHIGLVRENWRAEHWKTKHQRHNLAPKTM